MIFSVECNDASDREKRLSLPGVAVVLYPQPIIYPSSLSIHHRITRKGIWKAEILWFEVAIYFYSSFLSVPLVPTLIGASFIMLYKSLTIRRVPLTSMNAFADFFMLSYNRTVAES